MYDSHMNKLYCTKQVAIKKQFRIKHPMYTLFNKKYSGFNFTKR